MEKRILAYPVLKKNSCNMQILPFLHYDFFTAYYSAEAVSLLVHEDKLVNRTKRTPGLTKQYLQEKRQHSQIKECQDYLCN